MFELVTQILRNVFFMLYIKTQTAYDKPLTAKEEKECLEKMQQGDKSARDILISRNLRLVAHILKKYHINESDYDDMLSIGSIGLIKAADSFNNKNGTRFSTYAARCIENEILMHFRAQKKSLQDVSINDIIDIDKEGNELTLIDIISSDESIVDNIDKKLKIAKAKDIITNSLSKRERAVIIYRYGLNNKPPKSQQETADILGISRSYVSRIEKKCIEKLKVMLQ